MIKNILLGIVVIVVLFLIFRNVKFNGADRAVDAVNANESGEFMQASDSEINPTIVLADSQIVWFGENKIQAKSHTGTLSFAEGTQIGLSNDSESGQMLVSSGELVVDMKTLAGENEPQALVDHLRSADFFDVETYPEARFVVTSYSSDAVRGLLTMKDITEEVEISYTVEENEAGLQVRGAFALDRTVWGVTTLSGNFFAEVGDNLVEDTVNLSFTIQTN